MSVFGPGDSQLRWNAVYGAVVASAIQDYVNHFEKPPGAVMMKNIVAAAIKIADDVERAFPKEAPEGDDGH